MTRFLLAPFLLASSLYAGPFDPGNTVLFIGDSITQNGSYVANIEAWLWATHPERDVTIVNVGQSGETASGDNEAGKTRPCIHDRIDRILEEVTPDYTFICYGMNDGIYHPLSDERRQHYIDGIGKLVAEVRKTGSKIVLLSPPPFDAKSKSETVLRDRDAEVHAYKTPFRGYDEVLVNYGEWVMTQQGALADMVIDVGGDVRTFVQERRKVEPGYRHGDGVHPDAAGHLAMTLSILEGCGEDRAKAAALLSRLTGVRLLPDSGKQSDLWKQLKTRNNRLNAAYRAHCRKREPTTEHHEALAKAIARGGAEQDTIRKLMAEQSAPAAAK